MTPPEPRHTAELEAARTAARLAQHELELLSRTLAHDLRSPLMGIDGLLQVLAEDHAHRLDPDGQRYLELVRQSTRDFAQLIEAVVTVSRLTLGSKQSVDLAALARAEQQKLAALHPARKVELVIDPALPAAHGDPRLLASLVEQLLGNAWKFTGKQPSARVELGVQLRDGRTSYFVRDDGVGFDMASVGRLFVLFQRLHDAQEFEGRGLGLATVRRVVHLHGGSAWAESSGRGATFHFTLG